MTDPIADMLTRIRNAQMVKKSEVVLPYSKLKHNILNLLVKEGWLESVEKIQAISEVKSKNKKLHSERPHSRFATLKIKLKYINSVYPKISSLRRISKPGRRVYINKESIPLVLNGKGLAVISTSQGLMTDRQARQKKVGGEVICEIS